MSLPLAVLVSGGGSNLQSLIDRIEAGALDAEIKLVVSNNSEAYGLTRARKHGIPTKVVVHSEYPTRGSFDREVLRAISAAKAEAVILAGFMRILTPGFVEHYAGRLINIHPSLLPAFTGLHTHQRAIDAGCKFAGVTVHQVTAELDVGPILDQAVVPVLPDDTAQTLAARVLTQEHIIYPRAVRNLVRAL